MRFDRDSYIVLTGNPIFDSGRTGDPSSSFKLNNVFKQKETGDYLMPYLDSKGSKSNGWTGYTFGRDDNWRFATEDEISMYNDARGPVEVIATIDNYSVI